MPRDDARAPLTTLSPSRNFTLTLGERVQALVKGPPPYALRRRKIEDAEEHLRETCAALLAETGDGARAREQADASRAITRKLAALNRLIEAHNRYYPIEANLPLDPATGALFERGEPWRPMPSATLEALFAPRRAG